MSILPKVFKTNKVPEIFAALDIGSSSIKTSIFQFGKDTGLNLLGFGKSPIVKDDKRSMADVALKSLNEAKMLAQTNPRGLVVGLSNDKSFTSTTTVRFRREDKDLPIKQKEMDDLTARIQEASYIESSKELGERLGNPDLEISLLNSDYVRVYIDGLEVENPIGRTGGVIEASLFTAFSLLKDLELVNFICKTLGYTAQAITSNIYALTKALSFGAKAEKLNCVLIDIGGFSTDVAVVFGGGIYSSYSLGIGINDIAKKISLDTKTSLVQSQELLKHYIEKKVQQEESFMVRSSILDVLDIWLNGLETVFGEFEGIKTFPSKILVTGGGVKIPELIEVLRKKDWSKSVPFKGDPEIKKISVGDLSYLDIKNALGIEGSITSLSLSIIGVELWKGTSW